tara:strand:- start:697 stop:1155 length:459 start_codon:yes stop_codon:yes gene_type:complete
MKLEAFKKIIREEVRAVIKEELSLIMQTPITETKTVKKPVVEVKKEKPSLSNIIEDPKPQQQPSKPLFEGLGAISDVLNQTHVEGGWRDMGSMKANDAVSYQGGMPGQETKVVSSVNDMVAGQRTSDINQVSINSVPDFSGVMNNLKTNGKI